MRSRASTPSSTLRSPRGSGRSPTPSLRQVRADAEGTKDDDGENIKVVVRVRPSLLQEQDFRCALWQSGQHVAICSRQRRHLAAASDDAPKRFAFDAVFGPGAPQQSVFEATAAQICNNALAGFNGCLFAYGATGSGKTYTLYGRGCGARDWADEQTSGLVPRLARQLFRQADKLSTVGEGLWVAASILEIYNEQIHDLLAEGLGKESRSRRCHTEDFVKPSLSGTGGTGGSSNGTTPSGSVNLPPGSNSGSSLQLLQDPKHGVSVRGLTEIPVTTEEDLRVLAEAAHRRRATASTAVNRHSSRSHAVLRLRIVQYQELSNGLGEDDVNGVGEVTLLGGNAHMWAPVAGTGDPSSPWCAGRRVPMSKAVLHLVDLAGSERSKKAGTVGLRRNEGMHINASLMVLGQVISALFSRQQSSYAQHHHIPFRQSRLTHLLQDSLSGNSRTFMVAAVSPSTVDTEETLCTLRFAASVKCVRTRAQANVVNPDASLSALVQQHPPPEPPPRLLSRVATPQWPDFGAVESRECDAALLESDLLDKGSEVVAPCQDGSVDGSPGGRLLRTWSLNADGFTQECQHQQEQQRETKAEGARRPASPPPAAGATAHLLLKDIAATGAFQWIDTTRIEQLLQADLVGPEFMKALSEAAELVSEANLLTASGAPAATHGCWPLYEVCVTLPLDSGPVGPVQAGARLWRAGEVCSVFSVPQLREQIQAAREAQRRASLESAAAAAAAAATTFTALPPNRRPRHALPLQERGRSLEPVGELDNEPFQRQRSRTHDEAVVAPTPELFEIETAEAEVSSSAPDSSQQTASCPSSPDVVASVPAGSITRAGSASAGFAQPPTRTLQRCPPAATALEVPVAAMVSGNIQQLQRRYMTPPEKGTSGRGAASASPTRQRMDGRPDRAVVEVAAAAAAAAAAATAAAAAIGEAGVRILRDKVEEASITNSCSAPEMAAEDAAQTSASPQCSDDEGASVACVTPRREVGRQRSCPGHSASSMTSEKAASPAATRVLSGGATRFSSMSSPHSNFASKGQRLRLASVGGYPSQSSATSAAAALAPAAAVSAASTSVVGPPPHLVSRQTSAARGAGSHGPTQTAPLAASSGGLRLGPDPAAATAATATAVNATAVVAGTGASARQASSSPTRQTSQPAAALARVPQLVRRYYSQPPLGAAAVPAPPSVPSPLRSPRHVYTPARATPASAIGLGRV